MPDRGQQLMEETPAHAKERDRRKLDVVASSLNNSLSLPQKRKRKATEKEREKDQIPMKTLPTKVRIEFRWLDQLFTISSRNSNTPPPKI